MARELSGSLLDFIRQCIPTLQAAEVLLFFASHPDRQFKPEEVVVEMRPDIVTVPAVKEYLARFSEGGLIDSQPDVDLTSEPAGRLCSRGHRRNGRIRLSVASARFCDHPDRDRRQEHVPYSALTSPHRF